MSPPHCRFWILNIPTGTSMRMLNMKIFSLTKSRYVRQQRLSIWCMLSNCYKFHPFNSRLITVLEWTKVLTKLGKDASNFHFIDKHLHNCYFLSPKQSRIPLLLCGIYLSEIISNINLSTRIIVVLF